MFAEVPSVGFSFLGIRCDAGLAALQISIGLARQEYPR